MVKNRNLVRIDLLPSVSDVKELYQSAGIPEKKAALISQNYGLKVQMLQEFQKGITLSLYHERKKEKEEKWGKKQQRKQEISEQSFIMLCGIPGSGKSIQAAKICDFMKSCGMTMLDAAKLYPASNAIHDSAFLINKKEKIAELKESKKYQNTVMLISANEIQKELNSHAIGHKEDLIFYIAEMRTRIALMGGASVVYDALNLRAKDRKVFLRIADELDIRNKELFVMQTVPKQSGDDISLERLEILHQCLNAEPPSLQEGWVNIVNCKTSQPF